MNTDQRVRSSFCLSSVSICATSVAEHLLVLPWRFGDLAFALPGVQYVAMNWRELTDALDDIAPTRDAESWDNVGLLVGDPAQAVSKVLLTIDYTDEVAEEAKREGCDAVVAYPPPIFEAIKRVTGPGLTFDAIRRGVAIYSPHTALDVV